MSKYIIKNCPICEHCDWDNRYGELEEGYICKRITIDSFECKDIEQCLLKRIVEKCKETEKYYSECIAKNRETFGQYMDEENMTWLMGRSHHAGEILRLLDIQEVE